MADGFAALDGAVTRLMGQGEYAQAYRLVTEQAERYPGHEFDLYYLRSCLAARLPDRALALNLIREALGQGYFFGEVLLRQSPSWRELQGTAEFEDLAAISREMQRELAVPAGHLTALPHGAAEPHRAVLVLHGNGENASDALAAWQPVAGQDRLLASIQSSQVFATDRFAWDDQEVACDDVAAQFAALSTEHRLDRAQTIVAGFSMGANTALRIALAGTVPVRGFVLLGPGGPAAEDPESLLPLITSQRLTGTSLSGYLLIGELDDEIPARTHRRLADLLTSHGIPCGFELLPGLAHAYPDDFGPVIARALAFIDQEG